ncbi:MAG: type transport system ATP-binding protein, partial [Solirubrobacteraceae bacterium]|nr:type transport system ATP-binding protein [Solirubrobacteraceae bacterium]
MEREPALVVDGVSKAFRRPHEQMHTFKERALHPFKRRTFDTFTAVSDVTFDVGRGEFFGIVGRNGSGKSTLLKLMAGIYQASAGEIWVNGRLSTFIELGVGFNPDLAARDNVILNAIMLGLGPAEARERYECVIDFAELREFEDLKLKNYSSGMHVRLAFSVMIEVDADVLLVDEVLAVGDASFQQKCFDVFHALQEQGTTILFVTHDMGAVKRFCDRAMLLERGDVKMIGKPEEVGDQYLEVNFGRGEAVGDKPGRPGRLGDQAAEVLDAWFEDEHGKRTQSLTQGKPCRFRARIHVHEPVEANVAVLIENEHDHPVFATSSADQGVKLGHLQAGTQLD